MLYFSVCTSSLTLSYPILPTTKDFAPHLTPLLSPSPPPLLKHLKLYPIPFPSPYPLPPYLPTPPNSTLPLPYLTPPPTLLPTN
ncbi:hypothetical protein BDW02DRAFT_573220 [Decorospora gaudefroyi]|uniref:Uncharacterized protein n=1 Tax=Decorospora gaudefroyi TaxID=184978 RepID=A0A6A5K054_9PLEO|nr:hypothetical protein BDW02DRAFT_573220 [Decorospora gaudefroyi]